MSPESFKRAKNRSQGQISRRYREATDKADAFNKNKEEKDDLYEKETEEDKARKSYSFSTTEL